MCKYEYKNAKLSEKSQLYSHSPDANSTKESHADGE